MKAAFTLFLFTFLLNCNQKKETISRKEVKTTIKKTNINHQVYTVNHKDYTLKIKVERKNKEHYFLVIDINPHNGSWFTSPFEKKDFSGKFFMDLGSYKNLSFNGNIIETPKSKAIFDTFKNTEVKLVKEKTRYTQPLKVLSKDSFKVFGRIRFVIEPRCTLEVIPFGLSYKEGVFSFIDPKC